MITELKEYILSFSSKKKFTSGAFFYSRAIKHVVKRNKKIPSDLSSSVDKIVYGQ